MHEKGHGSSLSFSMCSVQLHVLLNGIWFTQSLLMKESVDWNPRIAYVRYYPNMAILDRLSLYFTDGSTTFDAVHSNFTTVGCEDLPDCQTSRLLPSLQTPDGETNTDRSVQTLLETEGAINVPRSRKITQQWTLTGSLRQFISACVSRAPPYFLRTPLNNSLTM